jgi:hypothetical protein
MKSATLEAILGNDDLSPHVNVLRRQLCRAIAECVANHPSQTAAIDAAIMAFNEDLRLALLQRGIRG